MFSIKRKMILFYLITLFVAPFMSSCTIMFDIDGDFKKLFERNVVWSDEEGKITITVQGSNNDCGFGTVLVNGQEERVIADFWSYNVGGVGIRLESEESALSRPYTTKSWWLDFKEKKGKNSATFTTYLSFETPDDSSSLPMNTITLTKRVFPEEELEARYSVRSRCWNNDIGLEISNIDETPFTGRAIGRYNSEDTEFFYLDDHKFRMIMGGELLGEGRYVTQTDGVTLFFDVFGSEEFGDSVSLVYWWVIRGESTPK